MCEMCSLNSKFEAFENAWLADEEDRICFYQAEDENGVVHTFREALVDYIQKVMPKRFDWSIHTSGYIDDFYSCIYVEAYDPHSSYEIPYHYVFNVEV